MSREAAAAFSRVRLAATLRDMGCHDEALAMVEPALQAGGRTIAASALLVAADIWRGKQQIDRSWGCLAQGLALTRQVGSKGLLGAAYRLLGQLRQADALNHLPAPNDDAPGAEMCYLESARLLRETHADDELALTLMAHAGWLAGAGRTAEARAALVQAQGFMARCGMAIAAAHARHMLQALPTTSTALLPGQRSVLLARHGTPRGRPLRADEFVEVIWTVDMPAEHALGRHANKVAARQESLVRLCAEAQAQGGEPTVGDLADALGVTPRTVDRDIAALRAAGTALTTRGTGDSSER